jgi:hypothetical protein
MALEVKESNVAIGEDMATLLENISLARQEGWVVSGPIVFRNHHLAQTIIKLSPLS